MKPRLVVRDGVVIKCKMPRMSGLARFSLLNLMQPTLDDLTVKDHQDLACWRPDWYTYHLGLLVPLQPNVEVV